MTAAQALAFVERHGVVLEAARHDAIPALAEAIAGETLHGNWWSHPKSRSIFAITRAIRDPPHVLVCRLVGGRISFVHERLWPALARLADHFRAERLGRVREVHSGRGAHHTEETPFPGWLTVETAAAAGRLTESEARTAFGTLLAVLVEET
jgi:hypothetical protein